jgi:putative MATE family efflux protein
MPQRSTSLWASVREAIHGSRQDFTEGPIGRAILLLAIPMVLEMVMESLFAVVDIFWVAHLGSDAITAVGLTESMLAPVFSIAMGISMSTTAMVARRVGEKDRKGAAVAAVQAIALGILVSVSVGIAGVTFAPHLLALMGASPDVVTIGHRYTSIVLGGCICILMLFLNNAIFRGAGDPAIAMRVLWLSNLINLVLDPCFIFGLGPFPRLGVAGAAVATTTGRGIGVLYQFWVLFRGSGRVRLTPALMRIDPPIMFRLLRVSVTGILQFAVAHTSWLALVRIVSTFGSQAVAGYTIAIRVIIFAILPSWGLSGAAATLVGQNLGAKRPDRAEKAVWRTGFYNMLFLGGVGLVFITIPERIIGIFTMDAQVAPYAVDCLRIVSFGNMAYAYGMVMVQSFNGAGDTVTPTVVNIFCYWLFEIPLAYVLANHLHRGPDGVFAAIPIAELMIALLGTMLFRRGRWKTKRI